MKKLIVFPLVFFALFAGAQEAMNKTDIKDLYPKRFISSLEFLAGPSLVYTTGNKYIREDRQTKVGYILGISVNHQINKRLDLNLRLSLERKGFKLASNAIDQSYTPPATERLVQDLGQDYIGVSLLPRYYIDSKQRYYIGMGTYLAYLIKAKVSTYFHRNDTLLSHSVSYLDSHFSYNRLDWGINFQLGYNVKIKKEVAATIQLLGNFGLINANKPDVLPTKFNSISLLVGILLHK